MDDTDLAAREHANRIAAFVVVADMAGGMVRRTDGVVALLSGLPVPNFNLVMIEDESATPGALAGAVTVARARGIPFAVDLRAGRDDRFVPVLADLGLVRHTEDAGTPGMALHPIAADLPAPPAGHVIRSVSDEEGIRDHVRVAAAVYGLAPEVVSAIVNPASVLLPHVIAYVGYAGGEAVSTGLAVRNGTTVGIYSVATAGPARRRGYGEAMTRRIAHDGAVAGCDVAILQASEMGMPIYARLGYRTVVTYDEFGEPGGAGR